VRSRLSDDGKVVELSVRDNGCGIAPENLDQIYLPFFTTKGAIGGSDTEGSGLGLYVVYAIVKNAGGDIRVETTVGQGTTFFIRMPVQDRIWQQMSSPENPPVDEEAVTLLARMRVLVVDDEKLLRDALMRYLGGRTAEVASASSGREALEMVTQHEYDLIFLDLLMPGINGLETMRRLRDLTPGVPVVLMTGKPESNIREQVMQRGAADLIRKPFAFAELSNIIRNVAQKRVRRSIA